MYGTGGGGIDEAPGLDVRRAVGDRGAVLLLGRESEERLRESVTGESGGRLVEEEGPALGLLRLCDRGIGDSGAAAFGVVGLGARPVMRRGSRAAALLLYEVDGADKGGRGGDLSRALRLASLSRILCRSRSSRRSCSRLRSSALSAG